MDWNASGETPASRSTGSKRRWPAFDGVRALAVLAVMTYHLGLLPGGYLGVDVFFVLSGFLISWILISEYEGSGQLGYRNFYLRRALRLFPALAALIVVCVVLVLADGRFAIYRTPTLTAVPFVVLYSGNWVTAFTNQATTGFTLGLLGITWTLAIEEQFYLLWPLSLSALLKRHTRQRIAVLLAGIAVLEMIVRAACDASGILWFRADASTLTHSDGLLLGSALALLWAQHESLTFWPMVKKISPVLGWVSAITLLLVSVVGHSSGSSLWIVLVVSAALGLLVDLLTRPASPLSMLLQLKPLQWIGQRSYGCYLWHWVIFTFVSSWALPKWATLGIDFPATLAVAALSYRFIERPFLERKRKLTGGIPERALGAITSAPH
jgi:peptidoglycan/LPS O-acetylase OafA/YrhL